jgi:hypothetical protein
MNAVPYVSAVAPMMAKRSSRTTPGRKTTAPAAPAAPMANLTVNATCARFNATILRKSPDSAVLFVMVRHSLFDRFFALCLVIFIALCHMYTDLRDIHLRPFFLFLLR